MREPKADRKFSFFSAKEVFYLVNFNNLKKKAHKWNWDVWKQWRCLIKLSYSFKTIGYMSYRIFFYSYQRRLLERSYIDEPKKTRTSYLLLTFTLSIDGIVKLVRKKIKLKRWEDSNSPNNLWYLSQLPQNCHWHQLYLSLDNDEY